PLVATAWANDPGPSALRFVTRMIAPRRPPGVVAAQPMAPGNARSCDEFAVCAAAGLRGVCLAASAGMANRRLQAQSADKFRNSGIFGLLPRRSQFGTRGTYICSYRRSRPMFIENDTGFL